MGVSGCGKSTFGRALAAELGWPFLDADDFHPPANIAKMSRGVPLDDEDRRPWLDALADQIARRGGGGLVLACSALKQAYRDRLAAGGECRWLHLDGPRELLAARLAARAGHFMAAGLLDSQLAILEPPRDGLAIDIGLAPAAQVARARAWLEAAGA